MACSRRARVAYNGRFSGYSMEWLYKLTVITLGGHPRQRRSLYRHAGS
jgi:hypothetical protein